jgi:Fic family protein
LITFLLVHGNVLHRPVLYLSLYLKRYRDEYYDRLMGIRDGGDWEGWLRFFLRGVAETAEQATTRARAIVALYEAQRSRLQEAGLPVNALRVLDVLYRRPLVTVNLVRGETGLSFATANKLVEELRELGIVDEVTGRRRDRIFRFTPYVELFRSDAEEADTGGQVEETEAAPS